MEHLTAQLYAWGCSGWRRRGRGINIPAVRFHYKTANSLRATVANHQKRSKKPITEVAEDVFRKFVGSALTIVSIYIVRKLVEWLLGKELLWDVFPIRYCADIVDFAVFLRFCWRILGSFNED